MEGKAQFHISIYTQASILLGGLTALALRDQVQGIDLVILWITAMFMWAMIITISVVSLIHILREMEEKG